RASLMPAVIVQRNRPECAAVVGPAALGVVNGWAAVRMGSPAACWSSTTGVEPDEARRQIGGAAAAIVGSFAQLPQAQRAVVAGRDRLPSAWQDGGATHGVVVLEALDLLARLDVPQPGRVVQGAREQPLAVVRESDGVGAAGVALEVLDQLARLQ